jgi:hypothetical protein
MRHFPFKILILCVLLPPLVYIYSIQFLEKAIQARYERDLSVMLVGDIAPLLDGSIRLQDTIRRHVDAFIDGRKLRDWGVEISVTVTAQDGGYLFPRGYEEQRADLAGADSLAIARENYRLLSEGLVKRIDVEIRQDSLLANLILFVCVAIAVAVLFLFYRRGVRKSRQDEQASREIIDELADEHRRRLEQLNALEDQRSGLSEKIALMQNTLADERRKASAAEDEMVEELVALEDKISQHLAHQNRQLQEIDALKEKIGQYEKEKESQQRQILKGSDAARKRFNVLYKKLAIHDRAIDGFLNLTEELQIKAEEVIHQLNDDPKLVQVKRKVFGKKNRETVFEVIFAYKGRLYYRTLTGNRIEVLVIGTKLSQARDLTFLDKL